MDQTLLYQLKQGWQPLCKFLDAPVPAVAFPHKNKGASLWVDMMQTNSTFHFMICEIFFFGSLLIAFISFLTYKALEAPQELRLFFSYPLAIARNALHD